jgi:hypothetical protein
LTNSIRNVAADNEATNEELLDLVAPLDEQEWISSGTREGWPVAAVARHIASGYSIHAEWISHVRRGESVVGTPDDLDKENAEAAGQPVRKQDVVAEIRGALPKLLESLEDLDPDELRRSAWVGPIDQEASVGELANIAAWHVRHHTESIRLAVSEENQRPEST